MGHGKTIEIRVSDYKVTVRDYGRGIPLGKVIDCVSKINTGGKYDTAAFQKSVGLNGGDVDETRWDLDIPKVRKAEAFYQQSNVSNPFKFTPDSNTIWGYDLGVEVSPSVMLVYQARTTYISDSEYFQIDSSGIPIGLFIKRTCLFIILFFRQTFLLDFIYIY